MADIINQHISLPDEGKPDDGMISNGLIKYEQNQELIMGGNKMYEQLTDKVFLLAEHLNDEKIVFIDEHEFALLKTLEFSEFVVWLKIKLSETYPEIKLKKPMKSIHYANAFSDDSLKQAAFTLDDIEQYLTLNKYLFHDTTVRYFNKKITSDGFTVTPINMVEVMIESLLICKNKNV